MFSWLSARKALDFIKLGGLAMFSMTCLVGFEPRTLDKKSGQISNHTILNFLLWIR